MATAREMLYDEFVAMSGSEPGPEATTLVRKVMARYRVQTKPGIHIPDGVTARDALGDRLLALWRQRPSNLHEAMGATIDDFRMQVKGAGSGAPKPPRRASPPARTPPVVVAPPAAEMPPPAPVSPPPAAPTTPAFTRGRPVREPVGGGPRQRGRTRSECPKCHSMGVVLARSYAGDEYFSCIYCGWQAYKPADESDPTASLAMKLLGHSFPEK